MKRQYEVVFGKYRIGFSLRRSDRQTLAITVQPDMSVLVTAPRKARMGKVMEKVRKRARWIRQQQRFFEEYLPKMPPRQFVSGETHWYLGRQYRLKVVEAPKCSVTLCGRFIWVQTPQKKDAAKVRRQVEKWYVARAKERFTRSLAESAARMGKRLALQPKIKLRRMPKRWGSWMPRGEIWLNPNLIKASPSCIDYVVTHELCHAVHSNHSKAFFALLRRVMPDWGQRKARLERVQPN